MAVSYLQTVQLAPLTLDDASQLEQLSSAPFAQIFERDRYGHLRPAKSALFWVLSRHPEWLGLWRAVALALLLGSAALGHALCTPLLGNRAWALLAAVCWAANPISASVLCWLSTANLVICLAATLGYLCLAERTLGTWLPSIAAIACLLLAITSHELGMVAPVLWFAFRRCNPNPSADRRRLVWLAIASASCVAGAILAHLIQDAPAVAYRSAGTTSPLHAPRFLLANLRLWFWLPGRFGVLFSEPAPPPGLLDAFGWLVLIALVAAWWRWRARDRALDFAFCWCACSLLPLMNLLPIGNTPVAMHYLYFAGFGLALAMVRAAMLPRRSWLPALALAVLIVAWFPEQRRALEAWRSDEALYTATLRNYPNNVEVRVNLIASYLDQQKFGQARSLLDESARLAPHDLGIVTNRFYLLMQTGEAAEALAFLDTHPELNTQAIAVQRGLLLMHVGRSADAALALRSALEAAVQPADRLAAGYLLVLALVQTEQYLRARSLLDHLLREFPGRPELQEAKQLLQHPY